MTTYVKPFLCVWCIHLRRESEALRLTCEAFPDNIPDDILDSSFDHRQTHPDDNGIIFSQTTTIEDDPPYEEMFGAAADTELPDDSDTS